MGYSAAIQVLKNADVYKSKILGKKDLLTDNEAWTDQQQLLTIYHQVIVLDLEYALDKKVEQELWSFGFKHYISLLQEQIRDKKNPKRSELQSLLSWSLEAASGFFITLLQELCTTFDLDLPFHSNIIHNNLINPGNSDKLLAQTSSCTYICQYCLVHLGDIARYRNERLQAVSFYKHAIALSPNSGQPYNQLALLEASLGEKLSAVYYYVQGIAVKNPFPGAKTNLTNTLAAVIDKDEFFTEVQTKMSLNTFLQVFLQIHAFLNNRTELQQSEIAVKSINSTLTALVATQSFTAEKLIKMSIINLFMIHNIVGEELVSAKLNYEEDLTKDELTVRDLVLSLIAGSLNAFLLPIYTLQCDETLFDYYALPAIKIIIFWIEIHPDILKESHFTSRLQIWPSFCKLLNSFGEFLTDFDSNKYDSIPLSEDKEIQGFLPLSTILQKYNFKTNNKNTIDTNLEKKIRASRFLNFGKWLSTLDVNNSKLIMYKTEENGRLLFEPLSAQPDPTNDILEELKSFKVADFVEETHSKPKTFERKGGILKPQGSLEKAREEREQLSNAKLDSKVDCNVTIATKSNDSKLKLVKHNVALQSILKKIEESKQVKFSTETTSDVTEPNSPISNSSFKSSPHYPPGNPNITSQYPSNSYHSNHNHRVTSQQQQQQQQQESFPGNHYTNNYSLQRQLPPPATTAPPTGVLNQLQFSVPPPQVVATGSGGHNLYAYPPPAISCSSTSGLSVNSPAGSVNKQTGSVNSPMGIVNSQVGSLSNQVGNSGGFGSGSNSVNTVGTAPSVLQGNIWNGDGDNTANYWPPPSIPPPPLSRDYNPNNQFPMSPQTLHHPHHRNNPVNNSSSSHVHSPPLVPPWERQQQTQQSLSHQQQALSHQQQSQQSQQTLSHQQQSVSHQQQTLSHQQQSLLRQQQSQLSQVNQQQQSQQSQLPQLQPQQSLQQSQLVQHQQASAAAAPFILNSNNSGNGGSYNSSDRVRHGNVATQDAGNNAAMTIRQAMLNEANRYRNNRGGAGIAGGAFHINMDNLSANNSPGYSLFNPSGWIPNIPGQSRIDNTVNDHHRQQSQQQSQLQQQSFGGNNRQPPQSLQQLIEQQTRLQKGDT